LKFSTEPVLVGLPPAEEAAARLGLAGRAYWDAGRKGAIRPYLVVETSQGKVRRVWKTHFALKVPGELLCPWADIGDVVVFTGDRKAALELKNLVLEYKAAKRAILKKLRR